MTSWGLFPPGLSYDSVNLLFSSIRLLDFVTLLFFMHRIYALSRKACKSNYLCFLL